MSLRGPRTWVIVLVLVSLVVLTHVPPVHALPAPGGSSAQALGLDDWTAAGSIDGTGLVIAIIDTGIDPSHPALQSTSGGKPKIIDWQDFTGYGTPSERAAGVGLTYLAEGDVPLRYQARSTGDTLSTIRGPVQLGSVRSVSGVYWYGFFRETQVEDGGPLGQDLGQSGRPGDEYLVVAVDSVRAGVYDVVYVDTRRRYDLRAERPMSVSASAVNWLGDPAVPVASRTPFVITHINPDGRFVNLGFDANGHGTHVAGIAAANDPLGVVSGIAPGASLMALKALRSGGDGSWSSISSAMEYAAANGADIISVSVSGLSAGSDAPVEESRMISELVARHDVLVILAAGNSGPGLATIRAPGGSGTAMTVGAAMTPGIWQQVFGYSVPGAGVYPFSSVGPRFDGSPAPNVLGPGAARSTLPLWLSADGTGVMEGTSMAVPAVAGAAALLWHRARHHGQSVPATMIKRALEQGAAPLAGVSVLEQGAGIVDLEPAWAWLHENRALTPARVSVSTEPDVYLGGDWGPPQRATDPARLHPGTDVWWVTNTGEAPTVLRLESGSPAVGTGGGMLVLPPGVSRRLDITYGLVYGDPGLHDVWVYGTAEQGDRALQVLHSWIAPLTMTDAGDNSVEVSGSLPPAAVDRHFIDVPPGVGEWTLDLQLAAGEDPDGRVRVFLIDPEGRDVVTTAWIGCGNTTPDSWRYGIQDPLPGVWEIIVYSSPALAQYELSASEYVLTSSVRDILSVPPVVHLRPTGDGNYETTLEWTWAGRPDILEPVWGGMVSDPVPGDRLVLDAGPGDSLFRELHIGAGTAYLAVNAANPSVPGAALDIYLYHYDRETGLPTEVARSSASRPGPGRVLVEDPAPGRYGVWIEVGDFAGSDVIFEFSWLALPVARDLDAVPDGNSLVLTAGAPDPRRLERLYGMVAWVSTRTGRIAATTSVVLEARDDYVVSIPATRVVAGLDRQVTINVRDAVTLKPVSVPVEVNGRVYTAVDGRLTLTMDIEAPGASIVVTVRPHGDHVPDRAREFFIEAYPAD